MNQPVLLDLKDLVGSGGADRRGRAVVFHFSANGVLSWVCDATYYVVGMIQAQSGAHFHLAGHSPSDDSAAVDAVHEPGRWVVWSPNNALSAFGLKLRFNQGETIYVRNVSGSEYYITVVLEIIDLASEPV